MSYYLFVIPKYIIFILCYIIFITDLSMNYICDNLIILCHASDMCYNFLIRSFYSFKLDVLFHNYVAFLSV